jgi:hypothetical protein
MRLVVDYFDYATCLGASAHRAARRAARHRQLQQRRASGCLGTSRILSRHSSSTTSPTSCNWVPRLVARLVARLVTRLLVDYFAYVARLGASARRAGRRQLLRLRRASGCVSTSHGSLSTTSPTPRVRVPRHVVRLITRLIVDYFAYAVHPGASARRAARRRLLRLRRASGCLGTSRGSSSTTPPTPRVRVPRHIARHIAQLVARLVVDYSAYAARPGASARHAARRAARRRLLRLAQACRLLLHPHRESGCLGMSRGSSLTTRRLAARLLVSRSH